MDRELLQLVGLEEKRDAYPAQLSGGQKQRVGIARALVHQPEILLCDEATSALDPETTQAILALLRDINRRLGLTIVLITHEMAVIREICDRVVVLESGRHRRARSEVWEVFGDPQHETTRQLLNPQFGALPEAIQPLLTPQRQDVDSRLLVRLRYSGQGAQPDLAAISAQVSGELTLLYSAVEWVDRKPTGQLLLLLDARHDAPASPSRRAGQGRAGGGQGGGARPCRPCLNGSGKVSSIRC